MPYFIIDKESKEFGFFGSLPVMVEKFGLDKSSLEYHFSRKKETKFENEKYEIFKGELERGAVVQGGWVRVARMRQAFQVVSRCVTDHPDDKASACCRTVCTAASCKSGG